MKEQLEAFVEAGKLVLNLRRLPGAGTDRTLADRNLGVIKTLIANDSHFECRWVNLLLERSHCVFTRGLEGSLISMGRPWGEVFHKPGDFAGNRKPGSGGVPLRRHRRPAHGAVPGQSQRL